ncbi:Wall associated protein [Candidatus Burkholderia brachyanthoides]|nr:Wall associated protein [Candidatus Burkholderia brachyanthoides]
MQAVNVSRSYAANGLNQFTRSGDVALGYDARGNLTMSGASTYGYDSKNELTMTNGFSSYYDPLGRLDQLSGDQVQFEYDGAQPTTELDSASNTILRRYVFGPGVDEPIVWYEGSGTNDKRYLDQDERGSITRITDATGKTLAINSYDEFGIPSPGNLGRFQYTGQA